MIRIIKSTSSQHAKKYFSEALSKSDYYINDQELQGYFGGKLAPKLGLGHVASKDEFFALCENRHPVTGKRLSPRTKSNRNVAFDINMHCPKSVSVAFALYNDQRILECFKQSVRKTMEEIESQAKTAIRSKGQNKTRKTGQLVWAEFIHFTARPIKDNPPDPHLHCHIVTFNNTYDDQENRYKAIQWRDIITKMPFHQAAFHKRLADSLSNLGYKIRLTDKSFELESVPEEVIKHFSKRTNEIGQIAKEKGITDAKELDALGAKTRSKKQKGLTMAELRKDWLKQVQGLKIDRELNSTSHISPGVEPSITYESIINQTLSHCFERASVVDNSTLLKTALRLAIGRPDITIEGLSTAIWNDNRIVRIKQKDQILCTTLEALKEEQVMVSLAKDGIGKVRPIKENLPDPGKDQQQKVINEVLTTSNRVCLVRGVAGSGKTTLMKKAINSIKDSGIKVTVVAPTSTAARGVLRSEGHDKAETVAKLLVDENMQKELKNGLLWVDEAGLLSNKEMLQLLKITKQKNARLVLSGDTRQHSAVTRGDALRILNTVAKLPTAEVNVIRRQQNEFYKKAVEDLSIGNIEAGFEKLNKLGSIKTIDPDNPTGEIVDHYLNAIEAKRTALIVSPTHAEGERITHALRQELKKTKKLGRRELSALKFTNCNLTEAEKSDYRSFKKGDAIQFNLPSKGAKRGSLWVVERIEGNNVKLIQKDGKTISLPLNKPSNFDVFRVGNIELSIGDKIRITRNSFEKKQSKKGEKENDKKPEKPKRMDNGLSLEVLSIRPDGEIKLRNPVSKTVYKIDRDFGHITHDYCVTSHASQGKTCDEVLIYQPAATFAATNAKQFYVSASRAKHIIRVYTDDKEELLEAAKAHGNRMSALELVNLMSVETDISLQKKRHDLNKVKQGPENEKVTDWRKSRGYEPSI